MCLYNSIFFHFQNISDVTIDAVSFASSRNTDNSSAMSFIVVFHSVFLTVRFRITLEGQYAVSPVICQSPPHHYNRSTVLYNSGVS